MTHDTYRHAEDGRVCIPLDDEWFVPLDAGGEGFACERRHGPTGPPDARQQVAKEIAEAIEGERPSFAGLEQGAFWTSLHDYSEGLERAAFVARGIGAGTYPEVPC